MAAHNELGKAGEQLAADHLRTKGYEICHLNWRCGHKELDIIARKDDMLVFVEVKTRRNAEYGNPEEAVTDRKIRRIVNSADAYLRKYAIDLPVRFDLISIIMEGQEPQLTHIEDAFYPPLF